MCIFTLLWFCSYSLTLGYLAPSFFANDQSFSGPDFNIISFIYVFPIVHLCFEKGLQDQACSFEAQHLPGNHKALSLFASTKNKTKQSKTSQRKATSGSLSMVSQLSGQHASKDSFSMCDSRKQRAKGWTEHKNTPSWVTFPYSTPIIQPPSKSMTLWGNILDLNHNSISCHLWLKNKILLWYFLYYYSEN